MKVSNFFSGFGLNGSIDSLGAAGAGFENVNVRQNLTQRTGFM